MTSEDSILDGYGETTEVTIPENIASRIESRVRSTDFGTRDEYVTFVLEEVLSRMESELADDQQMDVMERREIEERLDALGYK